MTLRPRPDAGSPRRGRKAGLGAIFPEGVCKGAVASTPLRLGGSKSRFSEEQIIGILKEHQAGLGVQELCCKHGISDGTFCNWRSKYGGMEVSDARRLKALEAENAKLKSSQRPWPRWGRVSA